MADNTGVPAEANDTAANPGNATGPQGAPDNATTPDVAAAVPVPGGTSTSATPTPGREPANEEIDKQHGRYWRVCKKCRHARPTRWSYWEDKRNPPTSRHFWYFVAFAWRYLSASRCPECKCKADAPAATPREEAPIQTQRTEQDILQPE
ncbi:hypothetical protein ACJ72_06142 [Emergomyces africanus]|uniref:Zinc-binding domain-containing protein n=1 Tax=Emergomyces africanus TaxID=1955775 RepID=A0A1B7NS02_9EURO|nr:hypothetical protein ACJ72_06142 [Emergomyces africanus]